jgi:hypothetical protein
MTDIKPHNYFNELSSERQEEHRSLDVMIAEAERYRKIGESVNMFESFQRWLKTSERSKSKRKKRNRPSVEQIAIARGIIKIHSQMTEVSKEVSH